MTNQMSRVESIIEQDALILITGANGFIGSRVVEVLLRLGYRNLRCLVRPSSNLERLKEILSAADAQSVEILAGNLLSQDDANCAALKSSVVFHLAAGVEKTFAGCYLNSVVTTRNLLEAVASAGTVKRFVNVSSFSVYSNWKLPRRKVLDETCEVENAPLERAEAYMYAKLKQDELLLEYSSRYGIPYVILRPGAVYGPGASQLTARVGINTFGFFLHLGGGNRIPLTYVENCAEAIVTAGLHPRGEGQVFNIVDDELPTSRQFLRMFKKRTKPFRSVYVPYPVFYGLCWLWEAYSKWSKGQLPLLFNRRRCAAYWKGNKYSNRKLKEAVGWRPSVSFSEAAKRYFESIRSTKGAC